MILVEFLKAPSGFNCGSRRPFGRLTDGNSGGICDMGWMTMDRLGEGGIEKKL